MLDLGVKKGNREYYERLSGQLEQYVSMDIAWSENLDVVGDGRQLLARSDSVDTVVISAVLEHVPIQDVSGFLRRSSECSGPTAP